MVVGLLAHATPSICFSRILRSEAFFFANCFSLQFIFFSEQPFYGNYSTLDSHTNTNFARVCLLVKMASRSTPLGQVKKKKDVSCPDFYKKEAGGRFFLLFIISFCLLSLHNITFPQGYVSISISISIIYLPSGTRGVVAQSPEPGAHDKSD